MKSKGINPITKQEMFQLEESDINWRNCEFDELSLNEQADILSVLGLVFLNSEIKPIAVKRYNEIRDRNLNKNV